MIRKRSSRLGAAIWMVLVIQRASAYVTLFGCERGSGHSVSALDGIFGRKCSDVEEGVDFSRLGYQLVDGTAFLTDSATDCCAKCRGTTGCRSWTWYSAEAANRPKHGCWCMTASTTDSKKIEKAPGAVSGIVGPFVSPGETRAGFDLGTDSIPYNVPRLLKTKDSNECQRYCIEDAKICRGWSYRSTDRSCRLAFEFSFAIRGCDSCTSGQINAGRTDTELVSRVISESCGSGTVSGTEGRLYAGASILPEDTTFPSNLSVSSDCCTLCARIRECKAWNFLSAEDRCDFFGEIPSAFMESKRSDSSGYIIPRVCPDGIDFDTKHGVGLASKSDISNESNRFQALNAKRCGERCIEFPHCRAWTFFQKSTVCALSRTPVVTVTRCTECTSALFKRRYATLEDKELLIEIENDIESVKREIDIEVEGESSRYWTAHIVVAVIAFCILCFVPLTYTYTRHRKTQKIRKERERIAADKPTDLGSDLLESDMDAGPSGASYQVKAPLVHFNPGSGSIGEEPETDIGTNEPHIRHPIPAQAMSSKIAELHEVLKSSRLHGSFFEYEALAVDDDPTSISVLDSVLEFEPGTVVAHKYRIEAGTRLGHKSAVVNATDIIGNTPVVLKFYTDSEEYQRELKFYGRTVSSNLFPDVQSDDRATSLYGALGVVTLPSMSCLVLERGEMALDVWLQSQTHLIDPMDRRNILYKISHAVLFLHENRIVHRDLKPGNIVVFTKSMFSLKLIDLGSAKMRGQKAPIEYTLRYAPPELISAHMTRWTEIFVSPASDMWSLGLIFWEILVGEPLFGERYSSEEVMAMLAGASVLPFEAAPHMWKQITDPIAERLVRNLLVRNPDERWPIQRVVGNAYFTSGLDTVSQQSQMKIVGSQMQSVLEGISRIEKEVNAVQEISLESLRLNAASSLILCASFLEIDPAELAAESVSEEYIVKRYQSGDLKCTEALLEPDYNVFVRKSSEPVSMLRLRKSHLLRISLMTATEIKTELPVSAIVGVGICPTELRNDQLKMKFYTISQEPHCLSGIVVWDTPRHRDLGFKMRGKISLDLTLGVRLKGSVDLVWMQKTVEARMNSERASFWTIRSFKRGEHFYANLPSWAKVYIHGAIMIAKIAH